MDNQKVIATLNNLLETTQDGVRGFVACAEGVTNPRLKMVFEAAARRCDEGAAELKAKIRSLGGEPATSGTVSGSIHRARTNIISSITGMDKHAGEDAAKGPMKRRSMRLFQRMWRPSCGANIKGLRKITIAFVIFAIRRLTQARNDSLRRSKLTEDAGMSPHPALLMR